MKLAKLLLPLCAAMAMAAAGPLADRKALTVDTAKKMAEAAEKFALSNKWAMVITILDEGGNLVYLERMDGAPLGSLQVAQEKARTAVNFSSPSKTFQDGLAGGSTNFLRLPVMPFEGGVPIIVNGQMIGGIGVSGGTAQQDGQVAQAGADWLAKALK